MLSVKVYLTHDNIFSLRILSDGTPVNLLTTAVSRVVVTSADKEIDSLINPEVFDYTTDGANGIIHFDFADIEDLDPKTYRCKLTIFDAVHPNGQVWRDAFKLVVQSRVVRGD